MAVIALVDCNNFYASCERTFNPKLAGVPVVVLSNNDGCVVARSAESKSMGIPMGAPYFKIEREFRKAGGVALSSNYALYADMSNRVMSILAGYSPDQEVYSIDESFLGMEGFNDLPGIGQSIRTRVKQWTGLPVCVGIGPSKTLAKLANHVAKKGPAWHGVCSLIGLSERDLLDVIGNFAVSEVWGVGRRISGRLEQMGITTVAQLRQTDLKLIRREFSVVMERTVMELRGISCLALEDVAPPKQQIMSSRSFGQPVFDLPELEEAVAAYVSRAAEKLRRQRSVAGGVMVHLETNPFKPDEPQYRPSLTVPLVMPTSDTRELIRAATSGLHRVFREGYAYKKAGVMLMELNSETNQRQDDLFAAPVDPQKSTQLMATMDSLNARFGRGVVRIGAEGLAQQWKMKRGRMSPSYTTRWDDLLVLRQTPEDRNAKVRSVLGLKPD